MVQSDCVENSERPFCPLTLPAETHVGARRKLWSHMARQGKKNYQSFHLPLCSSFCLEYFLINYFYKMKLLEQNLQTEY